MSAQRIDVSAALTAAVSELVTAAKEYLTVSRVLSEECEASQTRLEHALSQFGGPDPYVQAEEIRGTPGRMRELETDLHDLSASIEAKNERSARLRHLLFLIADFAVEQGPDPVESEVAERLAALKPKRKGGRA